VRIMSFQGKVVLVAVLCAAHGFRFSRRSGVCGKKGGELGAGISIVNGSDASVCEWRWQVGIGFMRSNGTTKYFCGAMLISQDWILTAAHCVKRFSKHPTRISAIAGDFNRDVATEFKQRRNGSRLFVHPEYNSSSFKYDIALVQLQQPMDLTACVGSVCLPSQGKDVPVGTRCWITGWGRTWTERQPRVLQEAEVTVITQADCEQKLEGASLGVDSTSLCVEGVELGAGGCRGDSGGPLVCETSAGSWTAYGTTSWGPSDCDRGVGVWSRIHESIDWIEETMANA